MTNHRGIHTRPSTLSTGQGRSANWFHWGLDSRRITLHIYLIPPPPPQRRRVRRTGSGQKKRWHRSGVGIMSRDVAAAPGHARPTVLNPRRRQAPRQTMDQHVPQRHIQEPLVHVAEHLAFPPTASDSSQPGSGCRLQKSRSIAWQGGHHRGSPKRRVAYTPRPPRN